MSSNSETSSTVVAVSGNDAQSLDARWMSVTAALKYVVLIVALIAPYASAFLTYLLPDLSDSFYEIRWVCCIFVFFFSLSALFRRHWTVIAVVAAAWGWLIFTPYRFAQPTDWLLAQGFRIHASPIEDYLSRCKLVAFIESGVKQTVGICERTDDGGVLRSVYYDTTGEFALPLFQRKSEWKLAMSQIENEELLRYRAWPMSGKFYRMGIPLEMLKGG